VRRLTGHRKESNKQAEPKQTEGGASHAKDSSHTAGDSTKAQNDVRDPSDPQTEPGHAEAADNVDDTGEGPNDIKTDGPGPRPIEQVAKEHGGDAGNLGKDEGDKSASSSEEKVDAPEEDDDGPQKTSKGEGTGELYVKSSGLKADGGNFDAANPGAGKEADRELLPPRTLAGTKKADPPASPGLLEKKGIHHEGNSIEKSSSAESVEGTSPERKEKKSLGQKIKAKLHRPTVS